MRHKNRVMRLWWLRMLVVLPSVLCMTCPAWAATRFVATTGNDSSNNCLAASSPCKTITHALTQVATNDTVHVAAGTYDPALGETFPLTIGINLTLTGSGADTTIINAGGTNRVLVISGATVVVSELTITGGSFTSTNDLGGGGGMFSTGSATLTNVAVSGNAVTTKGLVTAAGGGIVNEGVMTLTNATVSENTASSDVFVVNGGGIVNGLGGTMTLTNVTVSGNKAISRGSDSLFNRGFGGGIYNTNVMTLTNVTVTANTVSAVIGDGGGIWTTGGTTIQNTIVADNLPGDCGIANIAAQPPASNGFNLASDFTCTLRGPGDKPGIRDVRLGPLALNPPGTTKTHALLDGSPAIDAVLNGCPPPGTDQRGVTRPQGPACDIGAYEKIVSVSGGAIPTLSDGVRLCLAGLLLLGGLRAMRRRRTQGSL